MDPLQIDVNINLQGVYDTAASALTFVAHAVLGVGLTLALCSCRWLAVRVVYAQPARGVDGARARRRSLQDRLVQLVHVSDSEDA